MGDKVYNVVGFRYGQGPIYSRVGRGAAVDVRRKTSSRLRVLHVPPFFATASRAKNQSQLGNTLSSAGEGKGALCVRASLLSCTKRGIRS